MSICFQKGITDPVVNKIYSQPAQIDMKRYVYVQNVSITATAFTVMKMLLSNQACASMHAPGFLKLFSSAKSVCVYACVCVCLSVCPQAIKNHSSEMKPE